MRSETAAVRIRSISASKLIPVAAALTPDCETARPLFLRRSNGEAVVAFFVRLAEGDETCHLKRGALVCLSEQDRQRRLRWRKQGTRARGHVAGVGSLSSMCSGCRWLRRFFFHGSAVMYCDKTNGKRLGYDCNLGSLKRERALRRNDAMGNALRDDVLKHM
ncbi:hypothetical protein PO909_032720 [Leuciscus waleckii]